MWRADSKELFFVSDERKFYALVVPESGPAVDLKPQFLFDMHANVINTRNSYIPRADGERSWSMPSSMPKTPPSM
jgi:hypothetical protein